MNFLSAKDNIKRLKETYPKGTRLELIEMDDKQAPPAGTQGTVRGVDDIGSILMKWDNGGGFDRRSYKWRDEYEQALTISCTVSTSSYTEQDMLFVTADDVSVTFRGDFLKRFAEGDYGKKAEITLSFSEGTDWHIAVYHSADALYGTISSRTQGMRIPVQFNGNIVTTLEAVDPETGAGVGPHDWTTYKEFNYTFTVNYESGFITPTKEFKKEFKGDSVLFRIHYADGKVDEYIMDIADGIVSGTPQGAEPTFEVSDI